MKLLSRGRLTSVALILLATWLLLILPNMS